MDFSRENVGINEGSRRPELTERLLRVAGDNIELKVLVADSFAEFEVAGDFSGRVVGLAIKSVFEGGRESGRVFNAGEDEMTVNDSTVIVVPFGAGVVAAICARFAASTNGSKKTGESVVAFAGYRPAPNGGYGSVVVVGATHVLRVAAAAPDAPFSAMREGLPALAPVWPG